MRHVRAYLLRLANMFRKKHRRMLCARKFGCPKIRILATRKSRISMIGFFAKAHRCPAQALPGASAAALVTNSTASNVVAAGIPIALGVNRVMATLLFGIVSMNGACSELYARPGYCRAGRGLCPRAPGHAS